MSGSEILLILVAVLVLFGADKLPSFARGLGKGIQEIKKATDEIKNELVQSSNDIKNELSQSTNVFHETVNEVKQSVNNNVNEINSTINTNIQKDKINTPAQPDNSSDTYKNTESGFSNNVKSDTDTHKENSTNEKSTPNN